MAFTFLHSRQPGLEHPDDEAEDEMPMARSGSVRAFSHLPGRADGPPQVMVRGSGGMRPDNSMPVQADEMPMARSGSVRAISHLPDRAEEEDDDDQDRQRRGSSVSAAVRS